jgi:hypothetical protein
MQGEDGNSECQPQPAVAMTRSAPSADQVISLPVSIDGTFGDVMGTSRSTAAASGLSCRVVQEATFGRTVNHRADQLQIFTALSSAAQASGAAIGKVAKPETLGCLPATPARKSLTSPANFIAVRAGTRSGPRRSLKAPHGDIKIVHRPRSLLANLGQQFHRAGFAGATRPLGSRVGRSRPFDIFEAMVGTVKCSSSATARMNDILQLWLLCDNGEAVIPLAAALVVLS